MNKKWWILLGTISLIKGSFYEFVPRKTIKSLSEFLLFDVNILGHRIRQNDLILFGNILLIIGFVCFYKIYRMSKK